MKKDNLKVFFIATEQSGDNLGSGLMKYFNFNSNYSCDFYGIGGDLMIKEGLNITNHLSEFKSIGFFEIAKIKQLSEIEESLKYMQKALKFRKNFPPYIKLYINLLIQNKNYNLAKKSIKKAWNELPHAEYKESILSLAAHLEIEMSELVKYITGASYKNEESIILMVEAFVESKKWDDARNQIKDLLDVRPKKEVCLLMAKIEEGDSGDVQKINAWTQRAKDGAANNIWICTISKKSQQTWSSVSEAGYFNSLEWRQPIMLDSLEIYEGLKINGN